MHIVDRVLEHFRVEGGRWTASGVAEVVGIKLVRARAAICRLRDGGFLERVGLRGSGLGRKEAVYELRGGDSCTR